MLKLMTKIMSLLVVSVALALTAAAQTPAPSGSQAVSQSAGTYDELKDLLKNRYDQKLVVAQVPGFYAGERERAALGLGAGTSGVVWSHFAANMPVPERVGSVLAGGKKTSDLDQIDDHTFGDLRKGLNVSAIQKGESLKVSKFYVYPEYIEFVLETTGLGHLNDVDYSKASKQVTTSVSGNRVNQSVSVAAGFGFLFRLYFNKGLIRDDHDYAAIVSEIDKYLLSPSEAKEVAAAKQNVDIEPGMTEEQVVQKLGQPTQAIKFGDQKTLKYPGMTVVLKDGKVVDLKIE